MKIMKLIEHVETILDKPHDTWLGEPMIAVRASEAQQLTRALRIAVKALEKISSPPFKFDSDEIAAEALKEIEPDANVP